MNALPDPVPQHLPPGFVPYPDHPWEGRSALLSPGRSTPSEGPMESRMRQYLRASPSAEGLLEGPFVRVTVSSTRSLPGGWFEGLTGAPVEVSGWSGYCRENRDQISLIILREQWVIEVTTMGVSKTETLRVARSLDLVTDESQEGVPLDLAATLDEEAAVHDGKRGGRWHPTTVSRLLRRARSAE